MDKRKQLKDYSGQEFGLLDAKSALIKHDGSRNTTYWLCFCRGCGRNVLIRQSSLEKATSCGCQSKRNRK